MIVNVASTLGLHVMKSAVPTGGEFVTQPRLPMLMLPLSRHSLPSDPLVTRSWCLKVERGGEWREPYLHWWTDSPFILPFRSEKMRGGHLKQPLLSFNFDKCSESQTGRVRTNWVTSWNCHFPFLHCWGCLNNTEALILVHSDIFYRILFCSL